MGMPEVLRDNGCPAYAEPQNLAELSGLAQPPTFRLAAQSAAADNGGISRDGMGRWR